MVCQTVYHLVTMSILLKDVEGFSNDIYRIRRTILQMLSDRNYDIGDQLEDDYETFKMNNYDILENKILSGLTINCTHKENYDERVQVRFDKPYFIIREKELYKELQQEKVNHFIFIVEENRQTQKLINAFKAVKIKIEFFLFKEMMINITHHNLVPKHEPLSMKEKEELLKCYHIKENQLPLISEHDPICRYFGVEPGVVMRITRRSNTAGKYVIYRLVI